MSTERARAAAESVRHLVKDERAFSSRRQDRVKAALFSLKRANDLREHDANLAWLCEIDGDADSAEFLAGRALGGIR